MSKVFLKLKTSVAYNLLKSELMKVDPDLEVIGGDGSIQNIHKDLLRCVSSKFYHALEYSREKGHDIDCLGAIKVPGLDTAGLKCLKDLLYKGFHLIDTDKADDVINRLNNLDLSLTNFPDSKEEEWSENNFDYPTSEYYLNSSKDIIINNNNNNNHDVKDDNLNDDEFIKLKSSENSNFDKAQKEENCGLDARGKPLTPSSREGIVQRSNQVKKNRIVALKSTNSALSTNNTYSAENSNNTSNDNNCNDTPTSEPKRNNDINEYNTRRRSKPPRRLEQYVYSDLPTAAPSPSQKSEVATRGRNSKEPAATEEYILPTTSPFDDTTDAYSLVTGRPRRSSSARRQPLSDEYILESPLSRGNEDGCELNGRRKSSKYRSEQYEIASSSNRAKDAAWSNRLRLRKRKNSTSSGDEESQPKEADMSGTKRNFPKLEAATPEVTNNEGDNASPNAISQEDQDIQRITSVIKGFLPHPACFLIEDGNLECFVCGEIFRYRDNWRRHLLEQHFHLSFLCPHCGQKFKRRGKCAEHVARCR